MYGVFTNFCQKLKAILTQGKLGLFNYVAKLKLSHLVIRPVRQPVMLRLVEAAASEVTRHPVLQKEQVETRVYNRSDH